MLVLDAKKKARRLKIVGWLISSTSLILGVMSLLIFLYHLTKDIDIPITQNISELIANFYHFSPILKPVWDFAPAIYYPNILVPENLTFLLLVFIFTLGLGVRASGIGLRQRINIIITDAENEKMKTEITGQVVNRDILSIEVDNQLKDNWYTRPMGIISLTVIAGYLVNLLWSFTVLL
ncbi:hypothetical protein [uncultured Gammaproteobacteria bacterium]|nr:hypothetical protein [uncultured Gammaproteobacteria bacterium]